VLNPQPAATVASTTSGTTIPNFAARRGCMKSTSVEMRVPRRAASQVLVTKVSKSGQTGNTVTFSDMFNESSGSLPGGSPRSTSDRVATMLARHSGLVRFRKLTHPACPCDAPDGRRAAMRQSSVERLDWPPRTTYVRARTPLRPLVMRRSSVRFRQAAPHVPAGQSPALSESRRCNSDTTPDPVPVSLFAAVHRLSSMVYPYRSIVAADA